jgi:hypothetical protein
MCYGTRKAIAGMMKAGEYAASGAGEFVRRMDAAATAEDVRGVLAWAKARGGWFLHTGEDDRLMRQAFERAKTRTAQAL